MAEFMNGYVKRIVRHLKPLDYSRPGEADRFCIQIYIPAHQGSMAFVTVGGWRNEYFVVLPKCIFFQPKSDLNKSAGNNCLDPVIHLKPSFASEGHITYKGCQPPDKTGFVLCVQCGKIGIVSYIKNDL